VTSSSPSDGDHQVVKFRTARAGASAARPPTQDGGEDDLAAYARSPDDPAEYRHRMLINGAAMLFILALIGGAVWIATTMADMRRNQDCVLSGRRGCTPVEYDRTR